MRKGLQYPNTLASVRELQQEIAQELGVQDFNMVQQNKYDVRNEMINRRLVDRARFNLIGFK